MSSRRIRMAGTFPLRAAVHRSPISSSRSPGWGMLFWDRRAPSRGTGLLRGSGLRDPPVPPSCRLSFSTCLDVVASGTESLLVGWVIRSTSSLVHLVISDGAGVEALSFVPTAPASALTDGMPAKQVFPQPPVLCPVSTLGGWLGGRPPAPVGMAGAPSPWALEQLPPHDAGLERQAPSPPLA